MTTKELLKKFLIQAKSGDLKTAEYPKEWKGYKTKVSFGMGAAARVPWIAFTAPDITVSNGYFPVYLYYKDAGVLILSYGISETNEFDDNWPIEITNNSETIKTYLAGAAPRYGDSYVFRAYDVIGDGDNIEILEDELEASPEKIDSDLDIILHQYQQINSVELLNPESSTNQGVFYLEKQLEDFIIQNWESTDLGKKYDLIIEEGVPLSQQYRTDIGPIDILVKDRANGNYVVIELKKGQTSDDTVGQIARYMGWVEDKMQDPNVKGIIIASGYDRKLEYALKRVRDIEIYIYEIDFRLKEFQSTLNR